MAMVIEECHRFIVISIAQLVGVVLSSCGIIVVVTVTASCIVTRC